MTLASEGAMVDAERRCRQTLAGNPTDGNALQAMGRILLHRGRAADALPWLERSVASAPAKAAHHVSLAEAYRTLGKADAAKRALRRAVAVEPENAIAHCRYGAMLRDRGDGARALRHARRAVRLNPDYVEALNLLAIVSCEAGRTDEARGHFETAIARQPDDVELRFNLGRLLIELGEWDSAERHLSHALARNPKHVSSLVALGSLASQRGRPVAAGAFYRRALALAPDDAKVHNNMGVALQQLGDLSGARHHFDAALAIDPKLADGHKNRAILKLLNGQFADGFDEYAWRWDGRDGAARRRPFEAPLWAGEPLGGKSILVWGEQGIGDEIMFAGALGEIAREAARCVVECDPRLVAMFKWSWPGVEVIARTDPPALDRAVDYQCPAGALFRWRRRSTARLAPPARYLSADPARAADFRERYMGYGAGPRIGLSWRSDVPVWGAIKSVPADALVELLSALDAVFVTLQYGDRRDDLAQLAASGATIVDDPSVDQMASLEAFAAQIAGLDMVITISNATAHMAGALGVPCHVLLAHVPDWRWQLSGGDALWYPNMRLYRQPRPGDWATPLRQLADALARD